MTTALQKPLMSGQRRRVVDRQQGCHPTGHINPLDKKKAPVKEPSRRGITDGSSLAAGARPKNTPLLPRLTPTHSIQAP
jgi:hypothetical protein